MTPKSDAEKYAGWLNKAMDGYSYVFKKYLKTLLPLEEGDFWQLQHTFARMVCTKHFVASKLDYSRAAAEFFGNSTDFYSDDGSQPVYKQDFVKYSRLDAIRFVPTWEQMEVRAKHLLTINSLPEIYAESLLFTSKDMFFELSQSFIKTEQQLEEYLEEYEEENYDNPHFWIQFNSNSKNRVYERLEAAARGAFASDFRNSHGNNPAQDSGQNEEEC